MNKISSELKLALGAWLVGMLGLLIAFNVAETMGEIIVFLSIIVGGYAVIKGQIKFFKNLKSHRDKDNG